jgi:Ca2+-binding EF-hand superfamily protein
MKQAEQIALIFSKFDFDQSGSLDTSELTALFKENKYDIDTE